MKALEDKATFFVPTDTEQGQNYAESLAREASNKFGGATLTPGVGFWKGNSEPVTLITIYADRQARTEFAVFVRDNAHKMGIALDQEAVLVEVNGTAGLYYKGFDYGG